MLLPLLKRARSIRHPFPVIVGLLLIVFTAFAVNGSSVGMYHNLLYGSQKDSNLLLNSPRAIRSDEWVNWTVLAVSQKENDYHKFNQNLSTGQNLALQPDVPLADWSTLFRPHNWGFFVLPFDNAFAFRWWSLLALLLVASYFYAYRHLQNRVHATLFSIAVAMTPFIFWWYQSTVVGVLAYGFIFLLLFDRLNFTVQQSKRQIGIAAATYAYLMLSFALLFYPPFQIPIAIVLAFYLLGICVYKIRDMPIKLWQNIARNISPLIIGLVMALGLGALFVYQNYDVIHALSTSAYPGKRVIESGGLKDIHLFGGFYQAVLQSDYRSAHFIMNQSEISNFILLAPFLVALSLIVIYAQRRKTKRLDWIHLMVTFVIIFMLIRLSTRFGQPIFKLFLLDKVPPQRLLIGLGFAGFIQLIYLLKNSIYLRVISIPKLLTFRIVYATVCAAIIGYYAYRIRTHYPEFLTSNMLTIGLAAGFWAILAAFIFDRRYIALSLLAAFSIASTFKVMPLYHGLGELENGKLVTTMMNQYNVDKRWATVDYPTFEGIASVAGEPTVTGVNTYPDTAYWSGLLGDRYATVYNRQAHVTLNSDTSSSAPKLITNSSYTIPLQCDILSKAKVAYVLAPGSLTTPCLRKVQTVSYPNIVFYIYRVL